MEGYPIQIIEFNETKKLFELNPKFKTILSSNEFKDCNIAVVSIAGAFRKGKSFFLNFLLRYMHQEYDHGNSVNWMGGDDTSLVGLKFRGGTKRETIGIWIWSKLFTKVLKNGEKICVMLMDTQGIFDENATTKENLTIFSLSTMLSSVQIFNIFHHIQEDDLQHLQIFTEYGKMFKNKCSDKPFQKLLFLIRDWNNPTECNFGLEGGRQYIKQKLNVTSTQREEQMSIRCYLKSCYEHLDCVLLPYPGKKVASSVKYNFTGALKDIDDEFKDIIKVIVPEILNPEKVLQKKINGQKIKAHELLEFMDLYLSEFNSDKISAETLYEKTIKMSFLQLKNDVINYYNQEMTKKTISSEYIYIKDFEKIHAVIFQSAINRFNAKIKFGGNNGDDLIEIKENLNRQYLLYLSKNDSKQNILDFVFENPGTTAAIAGAGVVIAGGAIGLINLFKAMRSADS